MRLRLLACSLPVLGLALAAEAVTIDVLLDVDLSPGQVTYTIGVENADSGSGVSINGYTLDYTFDATELSFVSAQQLVSFGALGQLAFNPANNCTAGRCTAGNVPGFDSGAVGALFSITFDITGVLDDGLDDFHAGILNSVFDDVTQATGQQPFDEGTSVVSHQIVPEPGTASLLGIGLLGMALLRAPRQR